MSEAVLEGKDKSRKHLRINNVLGTLSHKPRPAQFLKQQRLL